MQFWSSSGEDYRNEPSTGPKVAVLMSGGVDSSVTALMLKREGCTVIGVTMKIPYAGADDCKRACCGIEAAHVCNKIGIPHYFLDVREEFHKHVIHPFLEWYKEGRTPSPCVDCNTEIKFRLAADYLLDTLGFDYVATGHYARIVNDEGESRLARARDTHKDQSYFLYGIPKKRLGRILFPLEGMNKSQTRAIAADARLPVARKEESMELCFTGQDDYRRVMDTGSPGQILDEDGNIIGAHNGIAHYTIGQRKGIHIPHAEPLYVASIDAKANTITVAPRRSLLRDIISVVEANVLIEDALKPERKLRGKIRSQGEPAPCAVLAVGPSSFTVRFFEQAFAPAPGQRLVLYDENDHVVAGGIIRSGWR
ncbi:MAG: tRNA 2-thiouridine(34) synthase MnmA [Armatimonadota bacterium]